MKPETKHLAALALLVALFGLPMIHLAQENRKLADDLKERKETILNRERGDEMFERGSRTGWGNRDLTVGQFLQQGPGIKDGKSLLRTYTLSRQNHHMVAFIKLRHDLGRMTLDELRQLRVDLRKAPDAGNNNKLVEQMISEAEIKLVPNDPVLFFDGVVKVARFDWSLQKSLTDWATKDPGAAIAWFQSKTAASDFQDGSYESRQNRAKVFAGLLQGIAATNLDLAVELFSKETGRHERAEAGNVIMPLAMKRAVEQGDEGLLRTVLETAEIKGDSFQQGANNPWFDYTRATGDFEKSVELLKSLENQQNFGLAMSAIISSQNEMSFREKADWLRGQVPDSEERLQALAFPTRSQLFDGSEVRYQETLESTIAQPPGNDRDIELLALVKVLKNHSKKEDARRSAAEISDPDLRERAIETLPPNPLFAPASD